MDQNKSASRRRILKAGLSATAAAGVLGCEPCGGASTGPAIQTRKRVRWLMASSFPSSLDTIYGASEVLSKCIHALSDGDFQVKAHQAGELVPGLQVLDAVSRGGIQVGQTAGYYYTGKNPALAFDTCVPFGLTSRQQTAWLSEGEGGELMRSVYADFNLRNYRSGNTGVQMGGWFKRKVESLSDLAGLKMRIPGMGGKVMDQLGVSVQVLAGGDIYPALERGAIDATEWVGPYDDEKLGFHQVAKFYHYPGWWEPGPSLSFLVNQDAWNELPSSYQAMFEAATEEASRAMQARYDAKNPAALQRLLATDIELVRFSDDLMEGARTASRDLLAASAAKDPTYAKILNSWESFRDASFRWFGTAEQAYSSFVSPKE